MNGFFHNLISYLKSAAYGAKELKNLSLSRLRKVFSLLGKNEKIVLSVFLGAALLSLYFSANNFYLLHTVAAPAQGGSYSEGVIGQPTYINPLLASQEPDHSLVNLIFSGLYKYDGNGQLTPDLASGLPQISDDQKQYTVNLKHGLTWQNGKTLTADDVVFTIQLLQDPNYKSPLRALWQNTTVEKLSDYSVKFTTTDVSGPFENNLTLPILPENIWQNVDAQNFLLSKNNLEAVGSGPYSVKEIRKLPSGKVEQVILNSFAGYAGGQPKISQVIIKFYDTEDDVLNAFHSREILGFGFTPLGSSLYVDKGQSKAQITTTALPQYQVVFFNLNNPILNDINVRQALTLATNRQEVIDSVFKGNALLPVSPLVFNDPKNPTAINTSTDINQAKSLLDKSGWAVDSKSGLRTKKGQVLTLSLATNDSLVNSQAAEILSNQWKQLGIQINLTVLTSKQLMDTLIKPRTFGILLYPQKFAADPDPFAFWHSSQVKDPGYNLTGFAEPAADKLIIEARGTTDRQIRAADYQQFNSLVASQFPVIFLDQTEFIYAVDSSVKNVTLNYLYDPSQRFYGVAGWYMDTTRVWK